MNSKMFLVSYETDDGFSCDLFVEAEHADDVKNLWLKHCKENGWLDDTKANPKIFKVPQIKGEARPICWSDVPDG